MDLSAIFTVSTLGIVPAWLLLLFAPRWRGTQLCVQTVPVFVVYALVYWIVRIVRPDAPEGAGLHSLESLMIAWSDPYSVIVTWLHILVVDLFVGAWIVRDALREGIRHALVAPCLLVAFVAAPLGFLFYAGLRFALRRSVSIDTPLCSDSAPALPSAP